MKNFFNKIRLAYTIFALIEVLAIALFCIFYFLNLFSLQKLFTGLVAIITVLTVVGLNIIFVAVIIVRLFSLRQESDLSVAKLLGSDVKDAYNFGMIGLAVVDNSNVVLWTSELFEEKQIKILDTNIYEWEPRLLELKKGDANTVAKVVINSRNYEVKLLKETGMFIFKDTTELEVMRAYTKDNAFVIGLIVIDNYTDFADTSDDSNDVISKVRNAIFEYSKKHQVLLRRYRNDAYFAVCNFLSLEEMKKDQFSLLETVRSLGKKELTPPTLSIGFAHGFFDVTKLSDMASSAIDIAMSRGGDQAIVSKYGEELVFFGGRTEASETRNKVKVRVLADSLVANIKNAKNVLILTHNYADMDAIGSCLGILAICQHLDSHALIVYDSKLVERKARSAFSSSFTREEIASMVISPKEAIDVIKPSTLLILVDCHKPSISMVPKLLEKASKTVVIDHHRRSEEFVEMPVFSYVEPSASSASELISELIYYSSANPRIDVNPKYATLMLSGIFLDSNFYKTKTTGIRTFEASMILKEFGADNSIADEFLKDEFEEYSLITQIASTLKTPHVGVVYCVADEKYIVEPATLAKVANQCIQMKGVDASFVIGKSNEKEVRISCRSSGKINVQLLAEKMGGGGHFTSAAVLIKNTSIKEVESYLLEMLDSYIKEMKNTTGKEK